MLKGKTVLIIEHESIINQHIFSVLRDQLNCKRVMQTNRANEALEILDSPFKKKSIHLIICDSDVPALPGLKLLEMVRKDLETHAIPFILVTSKNDKDSLVSALKAGVNGYIVKPFSPATLIKQVKDALGVEGRRAMKRFKGKADAKVKIIFSAFHAYDATLKNISQTGCAVRTTLFNHGVKGVYDKVDLNITSGGKKISLKGEVVRIGMDSADPPSRESMEVAFQFLDMDEREAQGLKSLIASHEEVGE